MFHLFTKPYFKMFFLNCLVRREQNVSLGSTNTSLPSVCCKSFVIKNLTFFITWLSQEG